MDANDLKRRRIPRVLKRKAPEPITERTEGVTIELTAEPEDIPVRGNVCVSDEPELDRAEEDEIIRRVEMCDTWAWCWVRVRVTYQGLSASDSLGACTYADENDFRTNGPYADMVAECLTQLNTLIANINACELAPHNRSILACTCGYKRNEGHGR